MADPAEIEGANPPARSGRLATALYLVGLVAFVLSGLAYLLVLLLSGDIAPVITANAAAGCLLVAWAARDTLADPTSTVTTVPGAVGTAMVLLAVYGLLATVVVAVTSPWHDDLGLAWLLAGGTLVAGVLGVLTFPLEALASRADGEAETDEIDPPESPGE